MYCKKNAGQVYPAFYDTKCPYDMGQTEARYFQLTA
jgi:hypothetical protein